MGVVDAIAREGKPCIIARAPGLMEVADTIRQGEEVVAARTGHVEVSRGSALANAG
jgi:hypothetical protein